MKVWAEPTCTLRIMNGSCSGNSTFSFNLVLLSRKNRTWLSTNIVMKLQLTQNSTKIENKIKREISRKVTQEYWVLLFFSSSKSGHLFWGVEFRIFLCFVPYSLLSFCFHTICSISLKKNWINPKPIPDTISKVL